MPAPKYTQAPSGRMVPAVPRPENDPLSQGYTRTDQAPAPAQRRYGEEALGLSRGVLSDEEKEKRRKAKIARGEPLSQEDLE